MLRRQRPDIYRYHDYRAFLKDWIEFQKSARPGFSMRSLSAEAGVAVGYLTPVLSGSRDISIKAFFRLLPFLGLSKTEQSHLENLVKLCTGESQEIRIGAIERMGRSSPYKRRNPNEAELVEFMSHWYYIAIREMAAVPGFQADPAWIQKQLKTRVATADIEKALEFLQKHGYLTIGADGVVQEPKGHVDCAGDVYKVALTSYHRQMCDLAARSIDHTPSAKRELLGQTLVIRPTTFERAREILNEAMAKIRELNEPKEEIPKKEEKDTSVYHVEVALFPLSKTRRNT
jgi:uncharacterized protein (TIGR02147 family)